MIPARVVNAVWRRASLPRARRFERALSDPESAQRQVLRRLLQRNARTGYGRAHGFDRIRSPEEYRRRVPPVGYADLAPLIDRIRAGEHDVLTAEPVRRLVPTGGSTGGRKLIPWTRSFAAEFARAIAPWVCDLFESHPGVRGGPAYWSVSPALPEPEAGVSAVPVGFDEDAAYLGGALRRLVRGTLAVPEAVRAVPDVETFRYLSALGLLRAGDLRLVSVWHPSFLALLLDGLRHHWPRLIEDIARGTVTPPSRDDGPDASGGGTAIPDGLRRQLRRWERPDPRRAEWLERVGPVEPWGLWPRLEVVSAWADGAAAGPARELAAAFPGARLQPKGLLATEGVVTIPLEAHRPLAVRSHFYEFLDENGRDRFAWELERGGVYSVVLSTGAGLYRYRLGDRVRVYAHLGKTPCLRFLGRDDRVSDVRGEKLDEGFVELVLERLFGGARPRFAMLAPDSTRTEGDGARVPGYTLYVDSGATLPPGSADLLDELLCANPGYRYCRRLGQLRPAAIYRLEGAGAREYLEREGAAGRRPGGIKPASLSPRADWTPNLPGSYLAGPPR